MRSLNIQIGLIAAILSFIFVSKVGAISTVDTAPGTSGWKILQEMGNVSNEVTPYQPTAISDASSPNPTITLNTPGIYRLSENMTKPIVITSSNVSLDLNEYGITVNTPGVNAISISPAAGTLSNVTIRNGYVNGSGAANAGVYVDAIAKIVSKIVVKNMRFSEFDHGMKMAGTAGYPNLCSVNSCTADSNLVAGFSLDSFNYSFLSDCYAINNALGYIADKCDANLFKNSMAMANASHGFQMASTDATGNLIRNCMSMANTGTGFLVGEIGSETGNLLEYSMAMANAPASDFDIQGNNNAYQNRQISSTGVFSWVNNVPASP